MKKATDDDGSIEAGMAFIPTTAFFLLVLQLVVAGSFQTIETIELQSWLNKSSLYAIDGLGVSELSLRNDRNHHLAASEVSNRQVEEIEFEDGAKVLIAKSRSKVPVISELASKLANSSTLSVYSEALAFRE